MNPSNPVPRLRALSLGVSAAILVAACGGGSDSDEGSSSTVDAERSITESAVTDPPDAVVETTIETTTTTEPVATDAPPETNSAGVEITPELCDTTEAVFAPGRALRFFADEDGPGVEAALDAILDRTDALRDATTSSDTDALVADLEDALDELIPIFEAQDFSASFDPASLPDGGVRFTELSETVGDAGDAFRDTLLDDCGRSTEDLDAVARDFADTVATLPLVDPEAPPATEPASTRPAATLPDIAPDTVAPADPAPSTESTEITDDSGRIAVDVPATWADVDGTPGPTEDRLVASTDIEGFLASFGVPGMFIEGVDVPDAAGSDLVTTATDLITSNYEDSGCTATSELPYADIAYTGTEVIFACVPGYETRLVVSTDFDETRVAVVVMVIDAGDLATRDLILDSFVVS